MVVELSERSELMVVEEVEMKPLRNARVVEVACSPVESLVNGKVKVPAVGQAVRQAPPRQRMGEAREGVVAWLAMSEDE